MSKLMVINNVTLDSVMQAPGRPDEDIRGGFEHGGWASPYNDSVSGNLLGRGITKTGAFLFGRRTYQDFASYWPEAEDNPFTDVLNRIQKYVVSTTLTEPLPWQNSTLLRGDAADSVAELKGRIDDDIVVFGSGILIQSLMRADLIDEFVLLIHPLVLGTGRRLFPDGTPSATLQLADSVTTTTGVIIATYRVQK